MKVAHLGDEIDHGDRRHGSKRTPRSKESPGGMPLSPHRLAIDSALQCMQSRKSQLDVRNVERPSKWNLARLALAGPQSDEDGNLTEVQKLLRRVKGEYTTVTQKEDVLETIMNATAHASFECLGRFEMEPSYTTRTAINTSAMKGRAGEIYRICHHIGRKDLMDVQEEDVSLVNEHGLKFFSAQAGEISHIGEEWMEGLDCSLGLALPAPRRPGKKTTFTKALSGLLVAKNMKATGALAQATAGDLLPERGFLGRCGDWCLIGLVNCQGSPKVAGPLAVMIAQEMPKALFQSPSFVENDPAAGLTEAFGKVHVLSAQELDVTLTGASTTVPLMNGKEIWVAHVGDCRCVMGVPDQSGNTRNFHISAIPLTQDHTLSQPKEFERVKAAGADVRKLVWDKTCRIFAGDSDYPGLALTRGIGHRLGHTVGVTHKPSISKLNREEMPAKSFLLLGSAGIWATFSESAAVNWVSRTFQDPQEAAMSLGTEALGRWQDPEGPRGNLPADAPENFAAFLLWPTQAPTQAEQRSFVLGPQDGRSRCHWREVKSVERSHALRELAAWGTPRDRIAWHVSPK